MNRNTDRTADAKELKQTLRKNIKDAMSKLEPEYCLQADQAIYEAVTGLPEYKRARTIFCFVGTKDEINTAPIIERALEDGKRMAVPRCVAKGVMEAFLIDSLDNLREGHYGILEPGDEAPRIGPEEIDLAVIPCLSCSRDGKRLGYGGGYYDRYLGKVDGIKAVICRGRIMREDLPVENHDEKVDMVIWEEGICRAAYNDSMKRSKAMDKQVLLINDLAGYGKVALSAMIPVLSHMGYNLYNLPTALVSNTLDYGKFDILETTGYIKNTINVWKELGFGFNAISTGFIVSELQAGVIADYCREQARKGTLIFVDPIMGDEGRLYNGVTEQTVEHMRRLTEVADYIVPNYTEAVYLAGMPYKEDGITKEEAGQLIDGLRGIGAKSVIVTSARIDGKDTVIGRDHKTGQAFFLPFTLIPVRFPGTGDIFASVLLGKVLTGEGLKESVQKAMDVVKEMILRNRDNVDKFKGIPVEVCLELIDG